MSEPRSEPAEFERSVRDALAQLYDLGHLQTHPLSGILRDAQPGGPGLAGRALQRALLDAIESLNPPPGTPAASRAWRRYRILEMRYIEGMSARQVEKQLTISKSEFYREHELAIQAVASVFRERSRRPQLPASAPAGGGARSELLQREADELYARPELEALDLAAALGAAVDTLRPLAAQMRVALSVAEPAALRPVVGDRTLLRQLLLSTIRAGLDRATPGALDVSVAWTATVAEVRIVARPRADRPARPAPDLTLAAHLAEASGMGLRADRAGRGWAIRLSLPIARGARLLVVDNNADFVALVARYLSQEGWEVVGADSTADLTELLRQAQANAILLDVMMPGRDGWEVLRELKASPATRGVPVLVCSVLDDPQLAASLGAEGYVLKPVSQLALLRALAPYRPGAGGAAPAP